MVHGGDYNPDQWLDYPEVLSEDMRLMKLSHCNEMTLGIFAWAALEPEEGKFNFEWLDKVFDDIHKAGGKVILATPSGARPAWLAQKYPEVLRTNNQGTKYLFGARHNHCYTSPIYREKVKIINQKLAERYKDHPALLAWHLSNEYGGDVYGDACYCDLCKDAF
ncbi:MAG: beta-galactosidase, partial [Clostridia bacterium]|nr:beta-galactosidase [Clostridia bacterium]